MLKKEWMNFFDDLPNVEQEVFERCIKAANARGDPILVIFSDGSEVAYGACAYARWNTTDNSYESRLIISKNRLSPLKKMSIDRVKLCGAVVNKRLKTFIEKESRYKFTKFYHIVDSQIVYGIVQKESYGFNTFATTRIGEIQQGTNKDDWYWVESKNNIADWITRGRKPAEIGLNSIWQTGLEFLRFPEHEWPICKPNYQKELPEQIKTVMLAEAKSEDSLEARIEINRYSNYTKRIRVTATITAQYHSRDEAIQWALSVCTSDSDIRAVVVCPNISLTAGFLGRPIQQHCNLGGSSMYNTTKTPPCCHQPQTKEPLHLLLHPLLGEGERYNHISPLLPWTCGAIIAGYYVFGRGILADHRSRNEMAQCLRFYEWYHCACVGITMEEAQNNTITDCVCSHSRLRSRDR
ncbi:hypothetical protein ACROYT_G019291 [Oculina patagonica]